MLGYQGHNKNMTCVTWQGYNMTCVAVKKQQQSVKFPLTLTNDASVPKCSYFPRHPPGWLCRLSTWYWWCFPCCPAWQARKRSVRKMMEVINWKELFTMKRTWYFLLWRVYSSRGCQHFLHQERLWCCPSRTTPRPYNETPFRLCWWRWNALSAMPK